MIETKNIPILDSIAHRIVDYGFGIPTVFFLEMSKHLSFISSQMLIFLGPVLTAFVSSGGYYDFADLLQEKENIEYLIQKIEYLMKESS